MNQIFLAGLTQNTDLYVDKLEMYFVYNMSMTLSLLFTYLESFLDFTFNLFHNRYAYNKMHTHNLKTCMNFLNSKLSMEQEVSSMLRLKHVWMNEYKPFWKNSI